MKHDDDTLTGFYSDLPHSPRMIFFRGGRAKYGMRVVINKDEINRRRHMELHLWLCEYNAIPKTYA